MDDVPSIGFHSLRKKYKLSIRQYTGLELRLFSLVKMRPISISLLKFKGLIGIF